MLHLKRSSLIVSALVCALLCTSLVLDLVVVGAQNRRPVASTHKALGTTTMTATLSDSFPDADGDGKAQLGDEITYTATLTNIDPTNALTNAAFTVPVDENSVLVAGSVAVGRDLSPFVVHCTFHTGFGGNGDCSEPSGAYSKTDSDNFTILGGQASQIQVNPANMSYNAGTGIFSFDATVQNLIGQSIGTIDGVTPEATGVRLFLNSATVTGGNGIISTANADGAATFTAANQAFYQFDEILAPNQTSLAKSIQVNVPSTVNSFTVDFLVSTKAAAKLVINEVLSNPGGAISDADGEWFEVYNLGLFQVNMQGFKIGDSNLGTDAPAHTIALPAVIQPNGFLVFGNNADTKTNGGVAIDYNYGADLDLANDTDSIRLLSPYFVEPGVKADRRTVGNILEIDRADYANGSISAQNGLSRELVDPSGDNSDIDGANWQTATTVYGDGGSGTPGAMNIIAEKRVHAASKTAARSASASTETVSVTIGTLAPGESATITYKVTIAAIMPMGVTQISSQGTSSDDSNPSVLTDDPSTVAPGDATITEIAFAPTAAEVSISGRVLTLDGQGLSGARVYLTDQASNVFVARTNPFGYYEILNVPVGQTYIAQVFSKTYAFEDKVVSVDDTVSDLDFVSMP